MCPVLQSTRFGEVTIDGKTYDHDVTVLPGGQVKKRKKKLAKARYGTSHRIGPDELERLCADGPEVVFIGTGQSGAVELTAEGREYLGRHHVTCRALPTSDVLDAYNHCPKPKAALIHVTC
jgi:hypothetical protein